MRTRRVAQLAGLCGVLVLVLLARLAQLQVLEHQQWVAEAWRARVAAADIPYRRGRILDRGGRVLAENRVTFDLVWQYRGFRRGHPAGQLFEACALLGIELDSLAQAFEQAEACARYWLACRPQDLAARSAREREDLIFYLRRLAGVRAAESEDFARWSSAATGPALGEAFPWAEQRHADALREARRQDRRIAAAAGEDGARLWERLDEQRRAWDAAARLRALRQAAGRAAGLDSGGVLAVLRGAAEGGRSRAGLLEDLRARWSLAAKADALGRLLMEGEPAAQVAAVLAAAGAAAPEDVAGLLRQQRFALHADRSLTLRRDLDFAAVDLLMQEPQSFPGFTAQEAPRRLHPEGVSPHLVGMVRVPDEAELERLSAQRRDFQELARVFERTPEQEARYRALRDGIGGESVRRDELLGGSGLEAAFDGRLRGGYGLLRVLRGGDEDAQPLELEFVPARDGEDLRLALDAQWTRWAEEALRAAYAEVRTDPDPGWSAEVVAALAAPRCGFALLDLRDGSTPVLATLPTYSPSDFRLDFTRLSQDPAGPLRQRALGGAYGPGEVPYPGSTFKPLVAAAALRLDADAGARRVECDGTWRPRAGLPPGRAPLSCDAHRAHGSVDMEEALMRSCNVYFYTVAEEIGYEPIYRLAAELGFGRKTGLEAGLGGAELAEPADVRDSFTVARTAIGQVTVAAGPLQMARLYGWLADGGHWRPHLEAADGAGYRLGSPALAAPARALIARGLRRVVEDPRGTAHDSRWPLEQFRVAGKTGTAQAGGDHPVHAWFTGWFPHDRPRWAFAILCENSGVHGGDLAAVALYRFLERAGAELLAEGS